MRDYLKSPRFLRNPVEYAQRFDAEGYCNLIITLINQTTYLLRRLIERQQNEFLAKGGIKEQMFKARIAYRTTHK